MSIDALDSGGAQIVDSILSEADSQARRIIENAELSARDELEKARKEAERFREETLARARDTGVRVETREQATARIESKRLLLKAREDLIARVLKQIEENLGALRRDSAEYARSLRALAKEAVTAIREGEVVLRFSKADAAVLNDALLKETASAVRDERGVEPKLIVRLEEDDRGGGCIAQSADGRVVFDNTYRGRLERNRREFRAMIVEEFTKHHG